MNAVDTGHDAVHGALRARVEARGWRRHKVGGGGGCGAMAGGGALRFLRSVSKSSLRPARCTLTATGVPLYTARCTCSRQ